QAKRQLPFVLAWERMIRARGAITGTALLVMKGKRLHALSIARDPSATPDRDPVAAPGAVAGRAVIVVKHVHLRRCPLKRGSFGILSGEPCHKGSVQGVNTGR